ncbi:MAG: T9SS type A sorting domain-containing protein [Saprospiraceae bacterium]
MGRDTSSYNGVFVARMDTFGNVIKLKIFQDPLSQNNVNLAYFSCEAICSTPDKGFIFAGATRFNKNIFVIKVDSTMEFEYYKEFTSSVIVRYVNYLIYFQEAYYAIGIFQTSNLDYDIFIQKTDLAGNFIWERTYGIPTYWEGATSAIIEGVELKILGNDWFDPNSNVYNDESSWNKIFTIDSSGVIKSIWRGQNKEEGWAPEGLLKIKSNYYYTTHPGIQPSSQTLHYAPEIVCRDSLFNIKWKRTYGDTFLLNWFSNIAVGPDSYLYAAGYIPDGVTWGRVCKINPENGDLVWDARDTAFYIPGWGSRNRMEGLTVLPSGSVIAVGYTVDYTTHENGLLYKVTADGCIDTLCSTVGIEDYIYNQQHKVKVYPNPAVDEINIDVGDEENLQLDIFNLQGQKIIHQILTSGNNKIILNNGIIPGMYFWRVYDRKGVGVESGKVIVE